jgi:hypothetical protein
MTDESTDYHYFYTKIYMICKILSIYLLDFQYFGLFYFRKSVVFERKFIRLLTFVFGFQ